MTLDDAIWAYLSPYMPLAPNGKRALYYVAKMQDQSQPAPKK